MQVLIVSATEFEVAPLREMLDKNTVLDKEGYYHLGLVRIKLLITGVGTVATTFHLTRILSAERFSLCINAGIAGSFKAALQPGSVIKIVSERFGDLGAELTDGSFSDLFEMKLLGPNEFPFKDRLLSHPNAEAYTFLPSARGLTVNRVHGSARSIKQMVDKYDPEVETMESAAFFYTCIHLKQEFLVLRAISNYVEPRNKDNWNIPLAISNLNQSLQQLLEALNEI